MRRHRIGCEILERRLLLAAVAATHDGVGYFVHPASPQIERYDLGSHTWLSPVTLAGATTAPTAIAVNSSGLFAAFGKVVYRYAADGATRTHLLNTATAATELLLDGPLLFVNATAGYQPDVTSIDTRNNTVVGTTAGWSFVYDTPYGASIAPGVRRIFGRTMGLSPSDIVHLDYNADGTFIDSGDSPYHGDFPGAFRTWVLPDDALVVDDSGTVYRTTDLIRAGSLGGGIDDVTFRGDGTVVARRGSKLSAYDSHLLPQAETDLGYVPDEILGAGDSVIAFTADSSRTRGYREEVVAPSRLMPPQPGPVVDPERVAYAPETVTVAADNTLLLFDREQASIFRWDPATAAYTQSLPLIGSPQFFAYSAATDTAYVAAASGLIRRLDLGVAAPAETPFATLAASPGGLATAGAYLFAQDNSGAWATHSTLAPTGMAVDSKDWNYHSREFVWSDANQRMYFFRDDTSPNDLLSEEINANGVAYPAEPPGGIGAEMDSPLHGSAGFLHPIRVAPDGSVVVLGSGVIHDARSLVRLSAHLANEIADAAWLSGDLYTVRSVADGTELQRWSGPTYELVASTTIPGEPVRLVCAGDRLVAVTVGDASKVEFTQFDAGLNVVGPSRVTASIEDATVVEGDGGRRRAVFSVTLSRPSDEPVLLAYATSAGSATPGRDYRDAMGFVTFQPGETRVTIGIRTFGDRFDEADESFSVTLQAVSGAQLGRAVGQGTIVDDDPAPQLTARDVTALEGTGHDGEVTFVLRLSAASGVPVSVAYATSGLTAVAGADFRSTAGIATFAPGRTVTRVRVPIVGDATFEADETFQLTLTPTVPGLATIDRSSIKATIRNDDLRPRLSVAQVRVSEPVSGIPWAAITLSLSAPAGVPVSVRYATADVTALARIDYAPTSGRLVFAPGQTSRTVYVAILSDAKRESTETFHVLFSAPVGMRLDRFVTDVKIFEPVSREPLANLVRRGNVV
jgi:hypothetical protein